MGPHHSPRRRQSMQDDKLDEVSHALRNGLITGDRYVRQTAPRWRRMARDLHYRWRKKLPVWVEPEDVEQELVMQVLLAVRAFDPTRGLPIGKYIIWSAEHRAQRAIHRMRGARIHGNEGNNPSRPESTFTTVVQRRQRKNADAPEMTPADKIQVSQTQAGEVLSIEIFEDAIRDATSVREVIILYALRESGGEPDEAALRIFESFEARVQCGMRDEGHARSLVRKVVTQVVQRFGSAA